MSPLKTVRSASDNPSPFSNKQKPSPCHPLLRKRARSPSDDPARFLKRRKLSRHDPDLAISSFAYIRPHPTLPKNQLQHLKLRPHSLFFNAILSDEKGSLVVRITTKGGPRILKLYPPRVGDHPWGYIHEYYAYTILENTHHSGSVAPRCYGCIYTVDVDLLVSVFHNLTYRQMEDLRSTHFGQVCRQGKQGRALLIEDVSGITARETMVTENIIRQAEKGLKDLHRRGVIHGDPAPRNLVITKENHISWIDYDMALTTAIYEIDDGMFFDDIGIMRREFGA